MVGGAGPSQSPGDSVESTLRRWDEHSACVVSASVYVRCAPQAAEPVKASPACLKPSWRTKSQSRHGVQSRTGVHRRNTATTVYDRA
eukprot:352342-Chlamydomonas_euryale.AAC.3